jgi:hypothetical protein
LPNTAINEFIEVVGLSVVPLPDGIGACMFALSSIKYLLRAGVDSPSIPRSICLSVIPLNMYLRAALIRNQLNEFVDNSDQPPQALSKLMFMCAHKHAHGQMAFWPHSWTAYGGAQ